MRKRTFGLRGHDHIDGMFTHMRSYQHLMADIAQAQNLHVIQNRLHRDFVLLNRAFHDGA